MNDVAPAALRAIVAEALALVLDQGRGLDAAIEYLRGRVPEGQSRAFGQDCIYGVLRFGYRLQWQLSRLLTRPLRRRDGVLRALLLAGLYQLLHGQLPAHAAVAETVAACEPLDRSWAKGLVNAVLRNALRRREVLEQVPETAIEAHWNHPQWLIAALTAAWPADWQALLAANDRRAPMTLRVNRAQTTREDYLALLAANGIAAAATDHADSGVRLAQAQPVGQLPGFTEGLVSVQDEAAQLAAGLLDLAPGQRVLDACAAPGGKASHMLERMAGALDVLAVDETAERLRALDENARRLGLALPWQCGDARTLGEWGPGASFQRILLDAPCSSTGVIRRHPDIKFNRRPSDVPALAATQYALLDGLWPLLEPGGKLLYCTCSVLPQENDEVIARWLATRSDAIALPLAGASWGRSTMHGRQILTGDGNMDGFYYALLGKA